MDCSLVLSADHHTSISHCCCTCAIPAVDGFLYLGKEHVNAHRDYWSPNMPRKRWLGNELKDPSAIPATSCVFPADFYITLI